MATILEEMTQRFGEMLDRLKEAADAETGEKDPGNLEGPSNDVSVMDDPESRPPKPNAEALKDKKDIESQVEQTPSKAKVEEKAPDEPSLDRDDPEKLDASKPKHVDDDTGEVPPGSGLKAAALAKRAKLLADLLKEMRAEKVKDATGEDKPEKPEEGDEEDVLKNASEEDLIKLAAEDAEIKGFLLSVVKQAYQDAEDCIEYLKGWVKAAIENLDKPRLEKIAESLPPEALALGDALLQAPAEAPAGGEEESEQTSEMSESELAQMLKDIADAIESGEITEEEAAQAIASLFAGEAGEEGNEEDNEEGNEEESEESGSEESGGEKEEPASSEEGSPSDQQALAQLGQQLVQAGELLNKMTAQRQE